MDGHGDIRVVETKLASNPDDLLVCQGLDYYIWAQAYRQTLIGRLGVPDQAGFEIHYVIGDTTDPGSADELAPGTRNAVLSWENGSGHDESTCI